MRLNFGTAAFLPSSVDLKCYNSQTIAQPYSALDRVSLCESLVQTIMIGEGKKQSSLFLAQFDHTEEENEYLSSSCSTCVPRRSILGDTWKAAGLLLVPIAAKSTAPAIAITSSEAETSYDKYAKSYDDLDGGSLSNSLGIEEARTKVLQSAKGRVLEIGVGTGLNLSKYKFASSPSDTNGVTSLTLVDISDGMMAEAKEKLNTLNVPSHVEINFVKADATADLVRLFGSVPFDTVVDTFSLCVMGNDGAKECLQQMRNIVKEESGRVLLIENARSSNSALGFYQDLTADAAAKIGGKGCVSNQNIGLFIKNTPGLDLITEEEFAAGVFRIFICKRV
jgi:methyltransferase OMS1